MRWLRFFLHVLRSGKRSSWWRRASRYNVFERLGERLALCVPGDVAAPLHAIVGEYEHGSLGGAYGAAMAPPAFLDLGPNGLPLLESLFDAPVAIFLDFDGYSGPSASGQVSLAPYDTDGNAATFGAQEQADILEGWQRIAAYFAPFDVNVTTVFPTVPFSWTVITPSANNGYSWGLFNGASPGAVNPQSHLLARTSGILHEIGHTFGLAHQASFDSFGNQTDEYRNAADPLHAVLMGADNDGIIPKWVIGHPAGFPDRLQDDVATIAGKIAPFQSNGGDGFRLDDIGDAISAPQALGVLSDSLTAFGVIERLTDRDAFSFSTSGGSVTIDATRDSLSAVDLKLEVYSDDGTILAAADTLPNDQSLSLPLAAGAYYAVVSSHGDYGDIGPYRLHVAAGETPDDPMPPTNDQQPPGNLAVVLVTNRSVRLAWDGVAGATGYRVERSTNGITFEVVATVAADAETYEDGDPEGHQRFFYRVSSLDAIGASPPSMIVNGLSRSDRVTDIAIMTLGESQLVIDWRDVSGDSGYRVERSTDGATFAPIATVKPNTPSETDSGLQAGDSFFYRIVTLDSAGDAATSEPVQGTTRPAAVVDISFPEVTADHVSLSWSDVHGETEYLLYRSSDTLDYTLIATLPANTTSYVDDSTSPVTEFYYYLQAVAGSIPGSIILPIAVATPGGSLPTPWMPATIGTPVGSSVSAESDGVFTLISGTRTTDSTSDALHFVHQAIHGESSIVARVADLEPTLDLSEAGLVIRESLEPDAKSFSLTTTPFSGTRFAYRPATGDEVVSEIVGFGGPQWLKLERDVNVFRAFVSDDGATWLQVGEDVSMEMRATVFAGLAVTGNSETNLYTATFDNVDINSSHATGDFNADGRVTIADIDLLMEALAIGSTDIRFDLTGDDEVTLDDLDELVLHHVETTIGIGTRSGDIDLDGRVDRHDALLFSTAFGSQDSSSWSRGDFDASGSTDLADLAILQLNFSPPNEPVASAGAVVARTRENDHGGVVDSYSASFSRRKEFMISDRENTARVRQLTRPRLALNYAATDSLEVLAEQVARRERNATMDAVDIPTFVVKSRRRR